MTKSTHNRQKEFQHNALKASGVTNPEIFDEYIPLWWRNPTNHNSLRLTHYGFKQFVGRLKLAHHTVKFSEPITSKQLLQLERLFQEPYYLRVEVIEVLGEQDAIMLQLHAGNLGQYLDNLQTNR